MVVVPCRRLWDPRSSRLRRGPSRAPRRHPRDPHLSKKSRGSTIGHSTSGDPHLGQSPPGTPGCRAGTPRWYSTCKLFTRYSFVPRAARNRANFSSPVHLT